jgi:hypothetical protein
MEPQLHFVLGMLQYLYYLLGDDHSTSQQDASVTNLSHHLFLLPLYSRLPCKADHVHTSHTKSAYARKSASNAYMLLRAPSLPQLFVISTKPMRPTHHWPIHHHCFFCPSTLYRHTVSVGRAPTFAVARVVAYACHSHG